MQTMAAALTAALPGETLAEKLVSIAQHTGAAVYDGVRWRFRSKQDRRTLRRLARAQGLRPPEPLETTDPDWEAEVLRQEARRRLAAREQVEARFRWASQNGARQALADGQGGVVARLVEADLPVTPETLAWCASLPADEELFPVEAHVPPSAIAAAEARVKRAVHLGLKSRSKSAALASQPLDLETPVAGVTVSAATAGEALEGLTPEVHRRAAIKRHLVALWLEHWAGTVPAQCPEAPDGAPEARWAQIAWLAFVGHALPPVCVDQRRWEARQALRAALAGTGLSVEQILATLRVAQRVAQESRRGASPMLTS